MSSIKKIANGVVWGIILNIVNALYGFIAVPVLISYFGKGGYGLISLALSVNVYLQLLDMGLNTTNIKFFTTYLAKNNYSHLNKLFQSSSTVYLGVGALNSLILLTMSFKVNEIFDVSVSDSEVLRKLFVILSITSIFNWYSTVLRQMVQATENVGWVQKMSLLPKLLQIGILISTVQLKFSLTLYFLLTMLALLSVTPIFVFKLRSLLPFLKFRFLYYHSVYKEVIPYTLTVLSFSVFSFSANNAGPIILGIRSGTESVADFRIVTTITTLLLTINGVFTQTLFPVISRMTALGNRERLEQVAESGTKYVSTLLAVLICLVILNSYDLLSVYVGENIAKTLALWLSLSALQVLGTHTSAIGVLVLAQDKLREIVVMSAISLVSSVIVSWLLIPYWGAGGAIVGLLVYSIMQTSYGYIYFYPKKLALNSGRIFTFSFLKPTIFLFLIMIFVKCIGGFYENLNTWLKLFINSSFYVSIAIPIIWIFLLDKDDKKLLLAIRGD